MKMTPRFYRTVAAVAISLVTFAPVIAAQQEPQPSPTWSQEDSLRIIRETQKRLGKMPYYGVFDWITFGIHGKSLVLRGYASRPTLKSNAESALKGIAGVDSIENEIEVLPNSPFDDRIRQAAYARIYSAAPLQKYSGSRGMGRGGPSVARMAGGITNDPPMGYHAINIIVKRGNIILYGVVLNSTDQAIAEMQANQTSGVFSVENNLVVEGARPKASK
jgi:hyperosmotically inducible protein